MPCCQEAAEGNSSRPGGGMGYAECNLHPCAVALSLKEEEVAAVTTTGQLPDRPLGEWFSHRYKVSAQLLFDLMTKLKSGQLVPLSLPLCCPCSQWALDMDR